MVKGGIPGGIYPKPPGYCVIRPGLLTTYPDAKFGLIGDSTAIALSVYIDTLGCRLVIIAFGMP